jgi:hypothetical protein
MLDAILDFQAAAKHFGTGCEVIDQQVATEATLFQRG